MNCFSLLYVLINYYILYNNITPFNTEPYFEEFLSIDDKSGEMEYYANVFSNVLSCIKNQLPFYVNRNPSKVLGKRARMNFPVLQHEGEIYLYDPYIRGDYIHFINPNKFFEVGCYNKKLQINFNRPFVETRMINLIYPLMYDYHRVSYKNLNMLLFKTIPDNKNQEFASFANRDITADDFFFVGYDFKNNKILEKLPVKIEALKLLIQHID